MATYYLQKSGYSISIPEYSFNVTGVDTWTGFHKTAFSRNGVIYYFIEHPSATDSTPLLVKSSDLGVSWAHVAYLDHVFSSFSYDAVEDRLTVVQTSWASPNITQYLYEFNFVTEVFTLVAQRTDDVITWSTFGIGQHTQKDTVDIYTSFLGNIVRFNGTDWEDPVSINPFGVDPETIHVINVLHTSDNKVCAVVKVFSTKSYDADWTYYFVCADENLANQTYVKILDVVYTTRAVTGDIIGIDYVNIYEIGGKVFITEVDSMKTPAGYMNARFPVHIISPYTTDPPVINTFVVFGYGTVFYRYNKESSPTLIEASDGNTYVYWSGGYWGPSTDGTYNEWDTIFRRKFNGTSFDDAELVLDLNEERPWEIERGIYTPTAMFVVQGINVNGRIVFTYAQQDKPPVDDVYDNNYPSAMLLVLSTGFTDLTEALDMSDELVATLSIGSTPDEYVVDSCPDIIVGSQYCTDWKDGSQGNEDPHCTEAKFYEIQSEPCRE